MRSLVDGAGVTLFRNTFLYSAFVVYMDLSKQACAAGWVPSFVMSQDGSSLAPFAKGAICANLAWMTVWPFDVIKTQRQSGYSSGVGPSALLLQNFRRGNLFKGLLPGLARSTIANGCSMVVYEFVHTWLSNEFHVGRKDVT